MKLNIHIPIVSYLLLLFVDSNLSINVTSQERISERNPYFRATDELLLDLRQQMITRSIKFDDHFRSLLSNSKNSLHQMFHKTYGNMYDRNTDIFTNMYESLEQYYAKGEVKLSDTMENFFQRLYQKIFQVFHQNKAFTPNYLECATNQLLNLKDLKDISDKLVNGIRQSFVAARTFEQALNAGVDFIKGVISLGQPQVCTNLINEKLIKNLQPNQSPKIPCLQFCEQVITRCIGKANLDPLDLKWKNYVLSLADLAKKLNSNYNIDTIISPMDVQISEAIMNFQENATNISTQVFQMCGKPANTEMTFSGMRPMTNRLAKRATQLNLQRQYLSPPSTQFMHNNHGTVSTGQLAKRPIQANDNFRGNYQQYSPAFSLASHLKIPTRDNIHDGSIYRDNFEPINQKSSLLMDEIKNYMLSTRNFWSLFPTLVCTSNHTLGSNASYTMRKQSTTTCFTEQLSMSDINSDLRYRLEFNKLVADLDSMRAKIEQALLGEEIDWTDTKHSMLSNLGDKGLPNVNMRPPNPSITTPSTSTTTTSPPDFLGENPDLEPSDDLDIEEQGSGNSEIIEDDEPENSTTEDPDYDPTEAPSSSTDINDLGDDVDKGVNSNEITTIYTIAPEQQKSSQSSSKLVIDNESFLVFASLMFVAIFIVRNRSVRIMISDQKSTVIKT